MHRQLPNQITLCRLALAAAFFMVLNLYRFPKGPLNALPLAVAIFILAALSDWLDGYLARKWKVESTFGRIMDPFCDKVLVLGAFIYLAGPRFVDPAHVEHGGFLNVIPSNMVTGVYPWMVAVMLARELLVTGVRDKLESAGVKFGANWSGKMKMVLQSVTIPLVLVIVWLDPTKDAHHWLALSRDILVYATVIVTVVSGVPYILGAAKSLGIKG